MFFIYFEDLQVIVVGIVTVVVICPVVVESIITICFTKTFLVIYCMHFMNISNSILRIVGIYFEYLLNTKVVGVVKTVVFCSTVVESVRKVYFI